MHFFFEGGLHQCATIESKSEIENFETQKFQLRKYQITIYSRSRRVDIPLVSLKMFQKTVRFQSNHPRESFKNVPTCGLVRVVQLTFGNLVGTALLVLVLRPSLFSVDSKKYLPIRKYILSRQKF